MASELKLSGTTARVILQGNDTISSDQTFTFPDSGGEVVTSTFDGDVTIDGNATVTGIVDGLCITARQDSTNSAVFRGTWDGAGNNFTSLIFGDGSATFAGAQTLDTSANGSNSNGYTAVIDNNLTSTAAGFTARNDNADGYNFLGIDGDNNNAITFSVKNDGSATFAGQLGVTGKGGSDTAFYIWDANNNNQTSIGFNANGSATFAGTMQLTGLTTTSSLTYPAGWVSAGQYLALNTSSARYKRDIETADPSLCLDIVNKLRPVWYRSSIETDNPDESYWGFLAEEVAEVEPRLTAYDAEGLPGSVDYGRFTPVLTSVLQQALSRIEALEAEVQTLKGGPVTADIPEGGTN